MVIYRLPKPDSSIDWNIDNVWAAGEGIINVEVNTTVPWAVYKSR